MSHPYWPQPSYIFRRQKAAPVPDAYGNYEFGAAPGPKLKAKPTAYDIGPSGMQAKKRGLGAVSLRALQKTYGSLSPKTDWATPRYIRNEPSGLGDFGDDNCLSSVIGTVAGKVDGWVRSIPGIGSVINALPAKIGPILISPAEITAYALNKAMSGFSAYLTGGDAAAHKYEMVAGIMDVLPAFPEQVPGLETYRGQIAQRIVDELINAMTSCMGGGGGGGGGSSFFKEGTSIPLATWNAMPELQAQYQQSCAAGSDGMTAEICAKIGYPFMPGGTPMSTSMMYQISPEFHMAPGFMKAIIMAQHPELFKIDPVSVSGNVGFMKAIAMAQHPELFKQTVPVMLIAGAAILAYLLIK